MTEKIHNTGVKVLLMALLSLVLGVSQGFTTDVSSILKEAEAKYAKFEEEIKDMTIVQEIKTVTSEGEITSEMKMLKKGEKFRIETTIEVPESSETPEGMGGMGGMETIIIYDGEDTWMISPFMGKKKLSGDEEKQYQRERNWWELISEKAEIVGTEKVGKRVCYVVEIKEEEEFPFTKVWLDKADLVLIKSESKKPEEKTVLLVHSDFRKIKGDWEMPYKSKIYVDGEPTTTFVVKSLEINKRLSDDLFDPDKVKVKIKGLDIQEMMRKMMLQKEEE